MQSLLQYSADFLQDVPAEHPHICVASTFFLSLSPSLSLSLSLSLSFSLFLSISLNDDPSLFFLTLKSTMIVALRSCMAWSIMMRDARPPCSRFAVWMFVSRIMVPATPISVQAGNINQEVATRRKHVASVKQGTLSASRRPARLHDRKEKVGVPAIPINVQAGTINHDMTTNTKCTNMGKWKPKYDMNRQKGWRFTLHLENVYTSKRGSLL